MTSKEMEDIARWNEDRSDLLAENKRDEFAAAHHSALAAAWRQTHEVCARLDRVIELLVDAQRPIYHIVGDSPSPLESMADAISGIRPDPDLTASES